MSKSTIETLKEALSFSPDNTALRLHLAQTLLEHNEMTEAKEHFQLVLKQENNFKAKFGLAQIFYFTEEYAACNVILEELIGEGKEDFDVLLLSAKALSKEGAIPEAIEMYQKVLLINPEYQNEELDEKLRLPTSFNDDVEEGSDLAFLEKPKISFDDVGGMDTVKKEIDLKIIQPLKHPEIYKAYGKKIGGGILLYGPPGCGKTFLAKATAGQVKSKFISVSLNDILDMWIGNSEKNLHEIFELARMNKPCVLFFDEIDALGASRSDMKQSSNKTLINQFLQELDGIQSENDGILVIGATNTPWHLDAAFRRPGRFDRILFVPPPDEKARESIFKLKLAKKPTEDIKFSTLANKTKAYSGADIEAIIDIAIENKLEEAIKNGVPSPLRTKDLSAAIKKHRPSTHEWFTSAKNFALYANESGLYDDILAYLNIKK